MLVLTNAVAGPLPYLRAVCQALALTEVDEVGIITVTG